MTETTRERANAEQRRASDPAVSAFVSASAGSGKTKLLTDRLLRLMLSGADPARIQCLTFTKAAAAEMALRLQRRLGDWVTMSDTALDTELRSLDVAPAQVVRRRARALFAVVLDLPGGMRIGTIHAFCQSLLRRFPLEAAISPHFELIEDSDAAEARRAAREDVLAQVPKLALEPALDVLAGLLKAAEFGELAAALAADRDRLEAALALGPDLAAAQRRVLGIDSRTDAELLEEAADWPESVRLREAASRVAQDGSPACKEKANAILDWLGRAPAQRSPLWDAWAGHFLKGTGEPLAADKFVNNKLHADCSGLRQAFLDEAARIVRVNDARRAARMAAASAALLALAQPVVGKYAERKAASGQVDFDDLIRRTSKLLVDPGAAWVLYKLDGGLDHLLLDEVQDTAPAQWRIAQALTEEFFAGEGGPGGETRPRTFFAVGDRKQSIFSFQGADIRTFDESRERIGRSVQQAGQRWLDTTLDVSFRSTAPVLQLVDRVFSQPAAARGVVGVGETLQHYANRADHAGSVEFWPLVPVPQRPNSEPWSVLDDYLQQTTAQNLLADELAAWIAEQTSGAVMLESRGRPLAPGDVMVLIRKRGRGGAFPRALVKAMKARGVPVAGLDRLTLTEQPAVQDLVALCNVLLLPNDDLSLACVLVSPLGGLDDQSLMALAVGRETSLWERLRARHAERPEWRRACDFLSHLLGRVDFVTPHLLLTEALGPCGGRARLFARLGAEAAEPIDELLQAAIAYGRTHPPSLQGFLHWLSAAGTEVKREPEGAGNAVRIMTVHGAKGLQAPLVVLPDTTSLPEDKSTVLWAPDPATGVAVPLWVPRKELRCEAAARLRESESARQMEEYNRLLYVALTRAEDRLLVCGWKPARGEVPKTSWYSLISGAFAGVANTGPVVRDWGERLSCATEQIAPPAPNEQAIARASEPLPAWAGQAPDWRPAPLPPEPVRPEPLAPSRPEGALLGPVPEAAPPIAERAGAAARFRRGQVIHALLQHLPSLPQAARAEAVLSWLRHPGVGLDAAASDGILRETLAILDHPELAPLFGSGSQAEVPLTGLVDGVVIGGFVDRLAVLSDRVLIADYKTSRDPPALVERTPVLYLRQMAAYRGVLRGVFPTRPVICALIWTQAARIAVLPDGLLDLHAPGTAEQTGLQGVLP